MKLDPVGNLPVIATEVFDLRPVRWSDMGLIEHYVSDERVARMTTTIAHPLPPGATEAFVTRCLREDRDEDVWIIDATRSGGPDLKGLIGLRRMDRNQSEVRYWVAPVFWNTGIARHAVEALVTANPLGNAAMFASVFQDNPASARVLTRCGFAYLGDAEVYSVARGATVPTWTYSRKL